MDNRTSEAKPALERYELQEDINEIDREVIALLEETIFEVDMQLYYLEDWIDKLYRPARAPKALVYNLALHMLLHFSPGTNHIDTLLVLTTKANIKLVKRCANSVKNKSINGKYLKKKMGGAAFPV